MILSISPITILFFDNKNFPHHNCYSSFMLKEIIWPVWSISGTCCCVEWLLASRSYSSTPWRWPMPHQATTRYMAGPVVGALTFPSASSTEANRFVWLFSLLSPFKLHFLNLCHSSYYLCGLSKVKWDSTALVYKNIWKQCQDSSQTSVTLITIQVNIGTPRLAPWLLFKSHVNKD